MRVSWIKVCGITTPFDARLAEEAGADAIGIRLIPGDLRSTRLDQAAEIAWATTLDVVLVVATLDADALRRMCLTVEPARLQFERLSPPSPGAQGADDDDSPPVPWYRALPLEGRESLSPLRSAGGDRFLVRIPAARLPGGDLHRADPGLLKEVGRCGRCVVGGDLGHANLAPALRFTRAWGIDLGSQVEKEPGVLDPRALADLVTIARGVEF